MARRWGKDKKLLLVPSDVVGRLMEISNRQGRSFYSLVIEILEQALRVFDSGGSLKEVTDYYALLGVVRSLGAKIMPDEAFNHLIGKLYPTEGAVLNEKWREFGRICGESLAAKYENPVDVLSKFLRVVECNLNEVVVTCESSFVKISCASPILSVENTELLASLIDGLMHGFHYKICKKECMRGIISLEYEKMVSEAISDKAKIPKSYKVSRVELKGTVNENVHREICESTRPVVRRH